MKLDHHFCLHEIWDKYGKWVKFGKKTRSLGQILEKPCIRTRGHIFSPIIMKLGQNAYLEISDAFESRSYGVKN